MIEEMKLRNFSPATQVSYVYAVSRLARYHKNHRISSARRMGAAEPQLLTRVIESPTVDLIGNFSGVFISISQISHSG
jgi:hypothetical protein